MGPKERISLSKCKEILNKYNSKGEKENGVGRISKLRYHLNIRCQFKH